MKSLKYLFLLSLFYLFPNYAYSQLHFGDSLRIVPSTHLTDPFSDALEAELFFEKYFPLAIQLSMHFKVPAAIILGVGALESGYGRADSRIVQECNNFFNIKSWTENEPRCCRTQTSFFSIAKTECYRKFDYPEDSFWAFSRKMHEKRYLHLLSLPRWDYRNWASGLQAAGYATDGIYADKLIGIIERYDLREYDPLPVPHPYDEPGLD